MGIVVLLVLLLVLAGPTAVAGARQVTDPVGDVTPTGAGDPADYDLVVAKHSQKRTGKLRHKVRIYGEARLGDDQPPTSGIRIEIDAAPGSPGDCDGNARDPLGRAEYVLSTESGGVLIDCIAGGIPTAQGLRMKAVRRVVKFTLAEKLIGQPSSYGWFASTGSGTTTADLAPNANDAGEPTYVTHQLRDQGPKGRDCGDLGESGAGVYDVRARRVGCRTARQVARRAWYEGDKRFDGWRCRTKREGDELWRGRCVKKRNGKKKVVRFAAGA